MWSLLSTPCSRFDLPLSREDSAFAHLDSLSNQNVAICTDNSVTFVSVKGGSGVLADCLLPYWHWSSFFISSSSSAKACTIRLTLRWFFRTNIWYFSSPTLNQSLLFFLLLNFFVFLTLPWHVWQGLSTSSSFYILWYCKSFPVTHFLRVTTRPIKWPDEVGCFSYLQSHVVSTSLRVSPHLVWIGGVLSHQNF